MYPKYFKGHTDTAYYRVDSGESYTCVKVIHMRGIVLQIFLEVVSGSDASKVINELEKMEQLKDFSQFNSLVNQASVKMREMSNYLLKLN